MIPLFEDKYELVADPSEFDCWEFDDVKNMDLHHVWTLIDGSDDNNSYVVAGFHVVNKFGYAVTTTPWTDENEEYLWAEGSDDEDLDDGTDQPKSAFMVEYEAEMAAKSSPATA